MSNHYKHITLSEVSHIQLVNPHHMYIGNLNPEWQAFDKANPPIIWYGHAFEGTISEEEIEIVRQAFDYWEKEYCDISEELYLSDYNGRNDIKSRTIARFKDATQQREKTLSDGQLAALDNRRLFCIYNGAECIVEKFQEGEILVTTYDRDADYNWVSPKDVQFLPLQHRDFEASRPKEVEQPTKNLAEKLRELKDGETLNVKTWEVEQPVQPSTPIVEEQTGIWEVENQGIWTAVHNEAQAKFFESIGHETRFVPLLKESDELSALFKSMNEDIEAVQRQKNKPVDNVTIGALSNREEGRELQERFDRLEKTFREYLNQRGSYVVSESHKKKVTNIWLEKAGLPII